MTHFLDGNQIQLLRNGAEYFPALEEAILSAKHTIYLQTYIYALDVTGLRIGNALKQAAHNGVEVNVLLDGFGCKDLPKHYVQELEWAGIQVMFYRPKISPWTLKTRRLRRLHRKVVVVDEAISFVGGINIIDDYDVPDHIPPRIDYALRIEGAIVASIVESVKKLWRAMAWVNLHKIKQPAHPVAKQTALDTTKPSLKAAFLIRNNVLHRHDIEEAYLEAISQATSEILIANAYFLPGKRFRRALVAAAKRGVSVTLLLQGHKEYFLMVATHAFYPEFLKAGIAIYEYHKSFMHSKVAVIDSQWATVGSSNIDPFSLLLSLEANVVIYDKVFADTLRNDIHVSLQQAHTITADTWKHVSMFKRFRAWLAYGFVKLSLSIIGYSND